ncbi:hypothetical protein OOJ09_30000 [Mesorhizobium qingshengii]|uniref:HTH HARE-type domain-containing protein n=1 Tax=Mesorhizobium qingshengii TaxID=1165689 RepID=A0ABT4R3M4_9HYPH|nr:hypothetical protein [Mesorhizobium qingshengii]MCZ8548420.1 hypothetical protein [Mesorhizobium qingshengii]
MTDESSPPPPPPEPPLTKPDALDEYETAGVISILIKTIAADDRIAALTKQLVELNASIAADRLSRAKGVNALSIYGFDPLNAKIWTAVREVIGDEKYDGAVAIARGKFPQLLQKPIKDAEKTEAPPQTDATISSESSSATPTISDAILAFLKECGASGAKVSAVKEQLSKAYGFETHEKTPGMTLYRLLKEGKVRRGGRIWFYVDPAMAVKTENPGDDTPGNDNTVDEKETTE